MARFAATSPLWLDEALSVNIASLPLGDVAEALRRDGHPPLYYWLLHGWTALFGDSDVAVRSLSGLLSVAALLLMWLAGRAVGGRGVALWGTVLLALSPFAVRYATEARMYALVMLLVLAGDVLLRRVLDEGRRTAAGLLVLVTAALLWTHYWGMYLVAAVTIVVGIRWWRCPEGRSSSTLALGGMVGGGLLLLPWAPTLLEQARRTGTPWAEPSRPTQILDVTLADLGGGSFAEARLYGSVLVLALVVGALGWSSTGHGIELRDRIRPDVRGEVSVIVLTFGIGSLAGYLSRGAYASRYASVVVPLVILIAASGLVRLRGWLLAGLAGPLLVLGSIGVAKSVLTDRTQAAELADRIVDGAEVGDLVVVCPDQLGPSLVRALDQAGSSLPVIPYPAAGDPRFVDWRDYRERNDAADPSAVADAILDRVGDGAIWLVWHGTYRTFEGDCESLLAHLGAARDGTVEVLPGEQFEPASLHRFG